MSLSGWAGWGSGWWAWEGEVEVLEERWTVPIISLELVFHKDCTQRGKGNSQMPSEDNQLKKRVMVLSREIQREKEGGKEEGVEA